MPQLDSPGKASIPIVGKLVRRIKWYGVLVWIVEYNVVITSIVSCKAMGQWEHWDSYTTLHFVLVVALYLL